MTRPPAKVGDPIASVDTPSLVVDLSAMERNMEKMAAFAKNANVRMRPHAKTHKCGMVAQRQLALGAVGVCCQKVSEAEAMVAAGVSDVLVSNEIVGEQKVSRLATLAKQATISVLADHPDIVSAYSDAAQRFGVTIGVLVELYSGGIRAGVHSPEAALELARIIEMAPGLRFGGLQAYRGPAQHIRPFEERRDAADEWCANVRVARDLLEQNGLKCESVTGVGTGTCALEVANGVYTEIQVGSYAFMDVEYGLNRDEADNPI
ncbi:MAG: alanine racemase, partial [Alphaproteobacteria bacterium]|nr:alanine racemase [Alphaproteobacteria bacterium]